MHEIDMMLKLQLQGKHKEARVLSDKLEAIGPDKILDSKGENTQDIWLRHCFNRGWFLIQDGDYQTGCQILENGRFLNVYGSGPLRTDAPIFNPKSHDIKGKSIIISLEGGYGDEIIHARFATSYKKLGADKVYLAAAPELVSILSRIEGVDKVILRNQANTVAHDYWIPGFSAGWIAGHTFDDFPGKPYLNALPESVEIWKTIIKNDDDKIKVGIRWAGNPKFEHQQFRRFPETFLTNLAQYKELDIYSFQRDNNLVQLPEGVTDLQHLLISWEDTAAAIMNLDIVITSCTSVAHLSAALGKETWVIIPCLPYHTWTYKAPDSTTSPYYETAKLFRQKEYGKWNDTFQTLYTQLEEKFELEHVDLPNMDKELKRLNLGCGYMKFEDHLNVDIDEKTNPDEVVDLNTTPWPWKDNEFGHIIAKEILEYLGNDKKDLVRILKEMYRISDNGAIWEIAIPHHRSDMIINNPLIKNAISPAFFSLFNQKDISEIYRKGIPDTSIPLIAFDEDIDLDVADVQYKYTPYWENRMRSQTVSQDELMYSIAHLNNVAEMTILLIEVHKPTRGYKTEIQDALKNISQKKTLSV